MQCSQELHFTNIIAFLVPFPFDSKQLYILKIAAFRASVGSVQHNTKIKLTLMQETSQCATLVIYSEIHRADFFFLQKGHKHFYLSHY